MIPVPKALSSSIFVKLVLTFLAVLVPLYGLTLLIIENGKSRIKEDLSGALQNRVHYALQSFETEVERIIHLQREYLSDQDLLELSTLLQTLTPFEQHKMVIGLQRRLYLLKSSSPYVLEAKALIPSMDRTIMSSEFVTSVDRQEWAALQGKGSSVSDGVFTIWNKGLHLVLQYPNHLLKTSGEPVFMLDVELYEPALREVLSSISNERHGQAFLVSLGQNWVISGDAATQTASLANELHGVFDGLKDSRQAEGIAGIKWRDRDYTVFYKTSDSLNVSMMIFVPDEQIVGSIRTQQFWLWFLSAVSVFIIVFFSYSIYRLIHRPLHRFIHAFKEVENGNMDVRVGQVRQDEFGYLYVRFDQMTLKLRTLIEQVYEQQIRTQQAELKRLQSQINPHFLYNSMFVLYQLIQNNDNDKAYRFAKYLGEYFRFITRDGQDDIPLREEMGQARAYVEIQKLCYGNRLQVEFEDIPEFYYDIRVPRLIVQPIIENAFNHVLKHKISATVLRITTIRGEDSISVLIEDNGETFSDEALEQLRLSLHMAPSEIKESTGLLNVHRRLQIKLGSEAGLSFRRGSMGGLHVEIKIVVKGGVLGAIPSDYRG